MKMIEDGAQIGEIRSGKRKKREIKETQFAKRKKGRVAK